MCLDFDGRDKTINCLFRILRLIDVNNSVSHDFPLVYRTKQLSWPRAKLQNATGMWFKQSLFTFMKIWRKQKQTKSLHEH